MWPDFWLVDITAILVIHSRDDFIPLRGCWPVTRSFEHFWSPHPVPLLTCAHFSPSQKSTSFLSPPVIDETKLIPNDHRHFNNSRSHSRSHATGLQGKNTYGCFWRLWTIGLGCTSIAYIRLLWFRGCSCCLTHLRTDKEGDAIPRTLDSLHFIPSCIIHLCKKYRVFTIIISTEMI